MVAPAEPAARAEGAPAAVSPPAPVRAVEAPVVSRFGEITPEFAATFGASVDVALWQGSRNAEARALASSARRPRGSESGAVLPAEIPTVRSLPPSRVQATFGTGRRR